MNILFDDNMPYAADFFSGLGKAKAFCAGQINGDDLARCEALLVRSTTKVDAKLIESAPNLEYVATATAGFNHIDIQALRQRSIKWYAAGGCNARAVAEYVTCGLFKLSVKHDFDLLSKSVGIVGVGNVGSALSSMLQSIGMKVVEYDPPRAQRDEHFESAPFDDVLKCDVISLHVPLVTQGDFPTLHMFNKQILNRLYPDQILINACRGEVLSNADLLECFEQNAHSMPRLILDCWEGEPCIDKRLLPYLSFATAHIAGHSLEGKANGTEMVYRDLCRHLNISPSLDLRQFLPKFDSNIAFEPVLQSTSNEQGVLTIVSKVIDCMYDIENDDSFFRRYMAKSDSFSEIRRNYPVRREWHAARIPLDHVQGNKKAAAILEKLGFSLTNDSRCA
ncbi:4-phosphoerythronate dehydrogenase [Ningiella sp. W23]|uniref:4-phosphoerythronate dehydrogenase n=1 Tax=Ningiella sp. W23 TaxID=3023715 RepID=UPI003757603C